LPHNKANVVAKVLTGMRQGIGKNQSCNFLSSSTGTSVSNHTDQSGNAQKFALVRSALDKTVGIDHQRVSRSQLTNR